MKTLKTMTAALGILILCQLALSETIIPGGSVSGTWESAGSPYLIQGNITIPNGITLNIQPGVSVIFQGHYELDISGGLEAIGSLNDSILFTAANITEGWRGLRFTTATDTSHLDYCVVQYGRNIGTSYPYDRGGGIFCANSYIVISHSTIRLNTAAWAAGLWISSFMVVIEYCDICYNTATTGGIGGINLGSDNCTLKYCRIFENRTSCGGGGIQTTNSNPIIEYCEIRDNWAWLGGGVYLNGGNPTFNYCTVVNNHATDIGGGFSSYIGGGVLINHCDISYNTSINEGGGIYYDEDHIAAFNLVNSILSNNTGLYGIYYSANTGSINISYSDFSNNAVGNFTGDVPTGLGIINTINANGDSCDVYKNIYLDPSFVDPLIGNYHLLSDSPCIDAGDPTTPLDPDNTVPDIGVYYFYQVDAVTINLTPLNPPIIIPPSGGSFQYRGEIGNSQTSHLVDIVIYLTLPGGASFPLTTRNNITLSPGAYIIRNGLTQNIPGSAVPGNYVYHAYIRDHNTWETLDEDSFPFFKEYGEVDSYSISDWNLSGWDEDISSLVALTEFMLHSAYPNPFNPLTSISFGLPQAAQVKLTVFNIMGREVAVLVNGMREAGSHQVTFDGSNLASGVYLYKLEAGDFNQVQKMVLLK